ncbi:hypothetical protein Zmor_024180 [Zophobas morio]|uniref:Uncharacterized protein n=1 Tax=Zophobas morio TaxID=2755281 RepID=A0AA38M832_9CUCU|nr:hypothetical protein Zmor_024180 [Zophobas morio]
MNLNLEWATKAPQSTKKKEIFQEDASFYRNINRCFDSLWATLGYRGYDFRRHSVRSCGFFLLYPALREGNLPEREYLCWCISEIFECPSRGFPVEK